MPPLQPNASERERIAEPPVTARPAPGPRAFSRPHLEALLSPETLARLAPTTPGVPGPLWQKVLVAPVRTLLGRPSKQFRGRLTEIAYRLGGGKGAPPSALAEMLEVVHAGSMIVDDIEDGSRERRGGPTVHRVHGVPLALNAGNWMYFAPYELLARLGLSERAELRLHRRISRVLLDCHYGQALDLGAHPHEVPQQRIADVVSAISVLKTGRLLSLAAEAGAIVAGADEGRTAAIAAFGEALGVGLQMLDDLGNLSERAPADKRYEDLRCGRVTWPWAWAATQLDETEYQLLLQQAAQLAFDQRLCQHESTCPCSATPKALPAPGQLARWQPLAARMRSLVGAQGKLAAHWHLHEALSELRLDTGPHRMLDLLQAEIARLEASYG